MLLPSCGVKSEDNLADICTKIMSGVTLKRILSYLLVPNKPNEIGVIYYLLCGYLINSSSCNSNDLLCANLVFILCY